MKVDLPQSAARATPRDDKPVFVTLKSDLALAIGNEETTREAFLGALDSTTGGDRNTRVLLRADKAVAYGDLWRS